MKKTFLLLAGFMLLASVAWSDEIELGIGIAPAIGAAATVNTPGEDNTLKVVRAAYTTLGIFQLSIDSLILPPATIAQFTGKVDIDFATGTTLYSPGIFRPGMINLVDFGIKFALFNKLVMGVQVGVNNLYVYHQQELMDQGLLNEGQLQLGANIKVSTGWKFADALGIEAAMYSIQPSVSDAIDVLKGLIAEDKAVQNFATKQLLNNAAFSALIVLYL